MISIIITLLLMRKRRKRKNPNQKNKNTNEIQKKKTATQKLKRKRIKHSIKALRFRQMKPKINAIKMQANVKSVPLTRSPPPPMTLSPILFCVLNLGLNYFKYIYEKVFEENPKRKPYIHGIYTTEYKCMYVCSYLHIYTHIIFVYII